MSPNRFEATITSNDDGSSTTFAASASMCSERQETPGNAAAREATTSSQNGIVCTIPFDFVADVTWLRRRVARSNA